MMVQKNLAQNEFIEIVNPSLDSAAIAAIGTGAATDGGGVFVLQVETLSGEFVTVKVYNGVTRVDAASNITGASQYAWAEVYGVKKVRVTRTDASGGNGTVGLSLTHL